MASYIYPKYKEALLNGGTNTALTGTVKATIIDTGDYTYSAAHDMIEDVPAGARVATQTLGTKDYTNGTFDAADVTFSSVTGDQSEAVIIWIDTTVESTSRLVAYIDSTYMSGLPVTPNGGNITITWSGSGIFTL
jgi:hypothetical protein